MARNPDREVYGLGTLVFAFAAMMLALAALFTAGQAYQRNHFQHGMSAVLTVAVG